MGGRTRGENAMAQPPLVPGIPTAVHDLSFDHKTSFNCGQLIPQLVLPTLPGDHWYLSTTLATIYPKLYLPLLHRMETHISFFFVSNESVWENWKAFIKPLFSATNPITWPKIEYSFSNIAGDEVNRWRDTIYAYAGFPVPTEEPGVNITAIPFDAVILVGYYKLWNDFFRRPQTQVAFGEAAGDRGEYPILRKGEVTPAQIKTYLTTEYSQWESDNNYESPLTTGGVDVEDKLLKPLYRNWNPDMFTMATFEPQYEDAVQVPMFDDTLTDSFFGGSGSAPIKGPRRTKRLSDDVALSGVELYQNTSAPAEGIGLSQDNTDSNPSYFDIQETAATMRQFAYAEALQSFLEKYNRTGDRYRNLIIGMWKTDPSPGALDYAVHIGSIQGTANVTPVLTTASFTTTNNPSSGAGSYTGNMSSLDSTPIFEYRCNQHGHIYGIVNIQPRSSYMQGVDKMWLRETWEDFGWPQFAHIGDEALKNKEVSLSWDHQWTDDENENTWGFVPRYTNFRFVNDRVSGELRDEWQSFHFTRIFDAGEVPPLDGNFLFCYPQESRVFEITGGADPSHTIYAWIWNQVKCIRPIPKYGIPMLNPAY